MRALLRVSVIAAVLALVLMSVSGRAATAVVYNSGSVTVDEIDSGFTWGGPLIQCPNPGNASKAYTRCWEDAGGYHDHYWTTWNCRTQASCPTGGSVNSGTWRPTLPYTASYRVCAFRPSLYGDRTQSARYQIYSASGPQPAVVIKSQLAEPNTWMDLGVFNFNAGTSGYVYLGDYTGEGDATVRIGFDAVQWVLDGGPCGSAPLLTDTDVDRVPDGNDDCPTTYDPNQTNTDVLLNPPGDALGDACDPDDDNDGLLDAVETNTTVFVGSSDTGTNPLNPDSDGDACGDSMELRSSHVAGGERDPNDKWDFYDVPVPALLLGYSGQMRDRGIGVTTDVIALLHYTGKTSGDPDYIADRDGNGVEDGLQYDRRLSTTPGQPWRSSAPDGGIGVTTDVIAMLAQAGNTCA